MTSGQNPYTDVVRFEDGNPYQEGRVFEGYPYPPVVLGTYGLAGSFTDPRLISSVAWLFFLGWLGWRAVQRRLGEASNSSLAVLMVLGLSPLNSLVWFMAWTEPLTLALFALAAMLWERYPKLPGSFSDWRSRRSNTWCSLLQCCCYIVTTGGGPGQWWPLALPG